MRLDKYTKQAIVRSIMNDVPSPDMTKRRADLQAAIAKAMSPDVRKVFKTKPKALRTHYFGDLIYDRTNWSTRDLVVGDVDDATLTALSQPYKDEDRARSEVHSKIAGIVEGCSTLKRLQTLLPEFKKYFPTEQQPTKNLPAVANVVADLTKLGWPKKETK